MGLVGLSPELYLRYDSSFGPLTTSQWVEWGRVKKIGLKTISTFPKVVSVLASKHFILGIMCPKV